jgi:predicted nicotinamide N-methyase
LVSISVAMGGAKRVIATDYEPLALALTRYAADKINSPPSSMIETQLLDLCDLEKQPLSIDGVDIVCAADIMYEPKTGVAMAHRAVEALRNNCRVIVGDSPGRVSSLLN